MTRAVQAGMQTQSDLNNAKCILEKDKLKFGGATGHFSKIRREKYRLIDLENDKILKSLSNQKSFINSSQFKQ